MRLKPKEAYALLSKVNETGRSRGGWSRGLRDGAVLALAAAGLSTVEIAALQAQAISKQGRRIVVVVHRPPAPWIMVLPVPLGERLAAWLTESCLWSAQQPVFRGNRGPLTRHGVCKIIKRYRQRPARPKTRRKR